MALHTSTTTTCPHNGRHYRRNLNLTLSPNPPHKALPVVVSCFRPGTLATGQR